MEREMDLIRAILFEVEESPGLMVLAPEIKGYTPDEITYHIYLLYDARLLEAIEVATFTGTYYLPKALTCKGEEFIAAARNDAVWKQFKQVLRERGCDIPLATAQALLAGVSSQHAGM